MKTMLARALARSVTMLGLGLWLGGILFLGAVSAPAIFRFCRAHDVESLAPQLVGALVARFGPLTVALGVVLCLAWLFDGWLSRFRRTAQERVAQERLLWRAQGVCLSAMLTLTLYLNFVALPELQREQGAVIRESIATGTPLGASAGASASGAKSAARLHFDALHQRYSQLTMAVFWLGVAALFALSWRLSSAEYYSRSYDLHDGDSSHGSGRITR